MASLYEVSCFAAGLAGNIFALALFLSPVPTFKRVLKAKSTEQFDGLPYLLSLLNCCICLWYGLPWVSGAGGRLLVATVNGTGAVFQLAYIVLFIVYADSRRTRMKTIGILALVVLVIALIAHTSIAFLDQPARQQFLGIASMASLISMFASPLAVMGSVVRSPDGVRGVHALLPVARHVPDQRLLRAVRVPAARSLHILAERARGRPWSSAAAAVRALQQEVERRRLIRAVARLIEKLIDRAELVVPRTLFFRNFFVDDGNKILQPFCIALQTADSV